jgi:hypothetical protein
MAVYWTQMRPTEGHFQILHGFLSFGTSQNKLSSAHRYLDLCFYLEPPTTMSKLATAQYNIADEISRKLFRFERPTEKHFVIL